jgi:ornithine cyclodeaminase
MRQFSDDDVRSALDWSAVLAALEAAFADPDAFTMPERVAVDAPQGGTFLTMPCVSGDGLFGVKQVSVLPNNAALGLPSVRAHYTLFGADGAPALSCGADTLTRMRTAGVSALAADRLAPEDVGRLLIVGSGAQAPWMAEAHAQVRSYRAIEVWGRNADRAAATAADIASRLQGRSASISVSGDLAASVGRADVISVATTASEPIVRGAWLHDGHHLDLVGAFVATMAEADPDAVSACDVVVDDREAARSEAGDLLLARAKGWSFDAIVGDLAAVMAGRVRRGERPTLFKSVGLALEDLVVARLLL